MPTGIVPFWLQILFLFWCPGSWTATRQQGRSSRSWRKGAGGWSHCCWRTCNGTGGCSFSSCRTRTGRWRTDGGTSTCWRTGRWRTGADGWSKCCWRMCAASCSHHHWRMGAAGWSSRLWMTGMRRRSWCSCRWWRPGAGWSGWLLNPDCPFQSFSWWGSGRWPWVNPSCHQVHPRSRIEASNVSLIKLPLHFGESWSLPR